MTSGIDQTADPGMTRVLRNFVEIRLGEFLESDEDDIFGTGLANSLFALELITFLEERFDIEIDVADLELDNFRSIGALARMVQSKLGNTE